MSEVTVMADIYTRIRNHQNTNQPLSLGLGLPNPTTYQLVQCFICTGGEFTTTRKV